MVTFYPDSKHKTSVNPSAAPDLACKKGWEQGNSCKHLLPTDKLWSMIFSIWDYSMRFLNYIFSDSFPLVFARKHNGIHMKNKPPKKIASHFEDETEGHFKAIGCMTYCYIVILKLCFFLPDIITHKPCLGNVSPAAHLTYLGLSQMSPARQDVPFWHNEIFTRSRLHDGSGSGWVNGGHCPVIWVKRIRMDRIDTSGRASGRETRGRCFLTDNHYHNWWRNKQDKILVFLVGVWSGMFDALFKVGFRDLVFSFF